MSLWVESSARIFARFQGLVEMHSFYPVSTVEYLINLQWRRSHCNANDVLVGSLNKIYPYGAQEWKVNCITTGREK